MLKSNSENYIASLKNLKREKEEEYNNDCFKTAEKIGNLLVEKGSKFDEFIMKKIKKELESGIDIDDISFNITKEDIPEYKNEFIKLDQCFKKDTKNLPSGLNKSNVFAIERGKRFVYGEVGFYEYLPGIHLSINSK